MKRNTQQMASCNLHDMGEKWGLYQVQLQYSYISIWQGSIYPTKSLEPEIDLLSPHAASIGGDESCQGESGEIFKLSTTMREPSPAKDILVSWQRLFSTPPSLFLCLLKRFLKGGLDFFSVFLSGLLLDSSLDLFSY